MTIAAGYVCNTGIVLCADTQETIPGYTKNKGNKLIAFQCPSLNLVFAGSGNNATQIDETAYEVAAQIIADEPKDARAFRRSLRTVLEELFPKAHYPRGPQPEVDMLMAIKWKGDASLYRISDCNVAPIPQRAAVGTGVILALQLLERHYDRTVQIGEAAIICSYVLYHVKKWVDGCGGNTEIALIPKEGDGITFMPSSEVDKFEVYAQAYDDALNHLLLVAPRTVNNLPLFNAYIDNARVKLQSARAPFQEWEVTFREVAEQLGMNFEQMARESEASMKAFLEQNTPTQSDFQTKEGQQ